MSAMEAVHEVLAERAEEVMLRWKAIVRGTLAPESMPVVELVDHLPRFLDEVIGALREDRGLTEAYRKPWPSQSAAEHGEQRLRLGFSLDSVVREYGALRDAVVDTARDAGVEVTFRDLQTIFDAIIDGIAHAVSEYSRQRDAELFRQHNEHVAFMAHELRNPLGSARLAVSLLKRTGQLPAEARGAAALERGLQRMQEGIDHSLSVARSASGIALRRERVSLRALLEDAEMGALIEADDKGITVRLGVEQDVEIDVDVRLIGSAVGNLVRNAVKYSCAGGAVEIRGSVVAGRISVEVEDCCGGLPPGKVEEAFAPFVRLDSHESGFGLGLAIAKQAVDAHGGTIRVQNLPGKGCIFVLELPAAP
jgi:signal transduction histidine kinase